MCYATMVNVSTEWVGGRNADQFKRNNVVGFHFSTRSTALDDFGMTKYNYGNIEVYLSLTTAKSSQSQQRQIVHVITAEREVTYL